MHGKGKPRHGGGQFRGAVSTYDKRTVIEKQRALKAKKVNKYRKALAKLEAEGRLAAPAAPGPADLDALFLGGGDDRGGEDSDGEAGQRGGGGAQRQRQQQKQGDAEQRRSQGRQQGGGPPTSGGGTKRPRQNGGGGSGSSGPNLPLPPPPPEAVGEGEHERPGGAKWRPHKGAPSQLERLAAKRQVELEQERAEKEERMKEAQRRREELETKTKQRKEAKAKFFAKTRRGQPVMKHRLDKILGALQAEQAGR